MEMNNLIKVESSPAMVRVNFEELQLSLAKELEKYDVVVTVDTISDARALATELNKTKKIIDDRRKEEVSKVSAPIREFDESMKDLVIMCEKGRQKILQQVRNFEESTKESVQELLTTMAFELVEKLELRDGFKNFDYEDLVKPGNLTQGGKLTKGSKDDLQQRVMQCRQVQDRYDRRLLELSNSCYEAGLTTPLAESNVAHILRLADDEYIQRRNSLIAAELDRQEVTEKKLREKIDKEQSIVAASPEPENGPSTASVSAGAVNTSSETPGKPLPAGVTSFEVTCVFGIEVPDGKFTETDIADGAKKRLAAAGISTLSDIYVKRTSKAA